MSCLITINLLIHNIIIKSIITKRYKQTFLKCYSGTTPVHDLKLTFYFQRWTHEHTFRSIIYEEGDLFLFIKTKQTVQVFLCEGCKPIGKSLRGITHHQKSSRVVLFVFTRFRRIFDLLTLHKTKPQTHEMLCEVGFLVLQTKNRAIGPWLGTLVNFLSLLKFHRLEYSFPCSGSAVPSYSSPFSYQFESCH